MTQYTLRNTYYGNFKNGKRHGQGTFLYANGTKYEGSWENNVKHGWVLILNQSQAYSSLNHIFKFEYKKKG